MCIWIVLVPISEVDFLAAVSNANASIVALSTTSMAKHLETSNLYFVFN